MSSSRYVEYKNTVRSLQSLLGLSCIDFWDTEGIHDYVVAVLEYLNESLVVKDAENIYDNIKYLCDIIDSGNREILDGNLPEFYETTGITEDTEEWDDCLFGIAWANVCTSLWASVKCNYAAVLWELEHQGCKCECSCGKDLEDTDNLYSKLVGNGSVIPGGCGCGGTV